ncbi:MAG: hypothetical protein COV76_00860 [Candidatus Omnitrophica bacterium CG11_big_fil_rev_8_21_14_0_20_64_10]|nr:MAG: hypothetical protein COV76_00860 [Candidatus Omnitrophica bacterium CG11_big_fil_rev_8_21_14_0_20_64_10]
MTTRSLSALLLLANALLIASGSARAETLEFTTYYPASATASGLGGPPAYDSGWVDWAESEGNFAWVDLPHNLGTTETFVYLEALDNDEEGAGVNQADRSNGVWWTNKSANHIRIWGYHGGDPKNTSTHDQIRVRIWKLK